MYGTRYPAARQALAVGRYAPTVEGLDAGTARAFYTDVLGGFEVRPAGGAKDDTLHFLVEGQRIDVRAARGGHDDGLELTVRSPVEIAERCWDAGFTVRLENEGSEVVLHVTDPLGRSIALRPRAGARA
jgi:hypothetical protein